MGCCRWSRMAALSIFERVQKAARHSKAVLEHRFLLLPLLLLIQPADEVSAHLFWAAWIAQSGSPRAGEAALLRSRPRAGCRLVQLRCWSRFDCRSSNSPIDIDIIHARGVSEVVLARAVPAKLERSTAALARHTAYTPDEYENPTLPIEHPDQ